jgi:hypothetical protein
MWLLQYKHTVGSHESCAPVLQLTPGTRLKLLLHPHIAYILHKGQQASIAENIGLDTVYIGCEGKILSVFN